MLVGVRRNKRTSSSKRIKPLLFTHSPLRRQHFTNRWKGTNEMAAEWLESKALLRDLNLSRLLDNYHRHRRDLLHHSLLHRWICQQEKYDWTLHLPLMKTERSLITSFRQYCCTLAWMSHIQHKQIEDRVNPFFPNRERSCPVVWSLGTMKPRCRTNKLPHLDRLWERIVKCILPDWSGWQCNAQIRNVEAGRKDSWRVENWMGLIGQTSRHQYS